MDKGYKFRAYPNKRQQALLSKTFGCKRFVYNYYLAKRMQVYRDEGRTMDGYQCSKDLTQLKKELPWLKEVDYRALQNAVLDLDVAYRRFFQHVSDFPCFKQKKSHRNSYRTIGSILYDGRRIRIPKVGWVKIRGGRPLHGRILNATVRQEPSGKYFISLCCREDDTDALAATSQSIGIDLGIHDYCTFSDGTKISNPAFFSKSQQQLAKAQRALARKTSGSANREKARRRVARIYEHMANQRRDFLHKLSHQIICQYDTICVEDLDVMSMVHDCYWAKQIMDASWSEFVSLLHYKADWYGREFVQIDRFYASSQTCSVCESVHPEVKDLSLRFWTCGECGTEHDRDINAAQNILHKGLEQLHQ